MIYIYNVLRPKKYFKCILKFSLNMFKKNSKNKEKQQENYIRWLKNMLNEMFVNEEN